MGDRRPWGARLGEVAPWAGLSAAAAWTAAPSPWWLVAAAAGALAPLLLPGRRRSVLSGAGAVVVLLAVAAGFTAHHRLDRLSGAWTGYWSGREALVSEHLDEALDNLLLAGEAAADELAALAADGTPDHLAVARLRRHAGFAAVALFGPTGVPLVWDGVHRGLVPQDVVVGASRYIYRDRPLFGHLYFTAPVPGGGGTAMVAALMRTDLPPGLRAEPGDFASRIRGATGEAIRISRAEQAAGEGIWDLRWEDRTLFSVSVRQPTQAERRREVLTRWLRVVGALVAAGWLLLAVGGRGEGRQAVAAATTLLALALLLPLGALLRVPTLFSAGAFLLPGPFGLTLGRCAALVVAAAVGTGLVAPTGRRRLRPWVAALPVTVGFPLVLALLVGAPAPEFLGGGSTEWVVYQLTLAFALALVAVAGLRWVGHAGDDAGAPWLLVAGLGGGLLLMGAGAGWARATADLPVWGAALWGLPAWVAARALAAWTGWKRGVAAWGTALVLGAGAALPWAWSQRIEARMTAGQRQIERLGHQVDPYLDFLLGRFALTADSVHARGAEPVEVLYRSWVESDLAAEGYPVWLTFWSPGNLPAEELRVGVGAERPAVADDFLADARASGQPAVRRFDLADAHYLAVAPLADGSVVTAVVPPLRELRFTSPLGPLFDVAAAGEPDPLTLVPLLPGDTTSRSEGVRWVRSDEGWQAELALTFPDALYHAHYTVRLSGPLLLAARGTLLLSMDLALFLLVWAVGRLLVQGGRPPWTAWRSPFASFRARVTLALFAFFLLSNAIFGTLAYRTIAGAAERAARVLAERVATDAAAAYFDVGGEMDLLARRVGGAGAELLEFRDGVLREASVEELAEIGLYEGWVPFPRYRLLADREALMRTEVGNLGRFGYVTAYKRLPDGDILGTPVPLQAGATAVRREEVAHLLGFAVLLGAALSLGLALLVGRTLTRPIQTLQVASERVGGGNLGVRLPAERVDEFGSVFEAFNRMVLRLRRARRDLVRTTRRTQAIVEDAATGVVAFDPAGRVTLANPMAESLLGAPIEVGEALAVEEDAPAAEFVRWVRLYFRDALREASGEFQFGDRRLRVRARRISREGALGGAVMSLEDVTDELRTERILAWGEMARQVAHEVKNPLTPIKLSIQHIRRAREDRRPDFDDILTRNADAMLREIDRLASIAASFSRFGAPEAAGAAPLEAVAIPRVVREVLALYSSGDGAIRFELSTPEALPPARGREAEMKEVLVNLLENARAAIADEGWVRVEAWREKRGPVVAVRDNGSGIPAELIPRIFEPHFSTRSTGTGLGLAIVRRLVESWGGTVAVESRAGEGTTVRLHLREWSADDAGEGRDDVSGGRGGERPSGTGVEGGNDTT